MILGAAIGGAVPNIPSWSLADTTNSVGGVLEAMLRPAHGFGKLVAVLLAFSLIGNMAGTMYSITLNFQLLLPRSLLSLIPRFVFSIVTFAIVLPVGIRAATHFFTSLENFLGVISYWPGCFAAVIGIEHLVFRKNDPGNYDRSAWQDSRRLPAGVAAFVSSIASVAVIVPGMNEQWFTGPIAKHTGDIGFELAFVLTACLYLPVRWWEIRLQGHL